MLTIFKKLVQGTLNFRAINNDINHKIAIIIKPLYVEDGEILINNNEWKQIIKYNERAQLGYISIQSNNNNNNNNHSLLSNNNKKESEIILSIPQAINLNVISNSNNSNITVLGSLEGIIKFFN